MLQTWYKKIYKLISTSVSIEEYKNMIKILLMQRSMTWKGISGHKNTSPLDKNPAKISMNERKYPVDTLIWTDLR